MRTLIKRILQHLIQVIISFFFFKNKSDLKNKLFQERTLFSILVMLPTPDYSHLKNFPHVYEPSEDTFLLIDALEEDLDVLNNKSLSLVDFVIEIGSGSGVVINFLAKYLAKPAHFLATDLNIEACAATRETSRRNNCSHRVDVINCDLFLPFLERLDKRQLVDILIFNPPYVLTEQSELGSQTLPAAWAGGENGRQVMDRLFPLLDRVMSPSGVFYLVCIKQNNPDEIETLLASVGFKLAKTWNRKAGIEHLFILKFIRK
jgi:release factor glutamine methyltransferase